MVDFIWIERTVERSAYLGLKELSLQLAHALKDQADTASSAFPVFSHIYATRALIIAGADEAAIRKGISDAKSFFPQDNKEVVGIGIVSGPIVWGSSGLEAEARRAIANLQARIGHVEGAIHMMDGIDDPVFAWSDMLTSDIPLKHLNDLLDAASAILTDEEHAYVRAQHAQELLFFGGMKKQLYWARATANDLLQGRQLSGDRAVLIYSSLTRVGAKLEDQDIERLALTKMAQAALISRDFGDLITAGFRWHQSSLTP